MDEPLRLSFRLRQLHKDSSFGIWVQIRIPDRGFETAVSLARQHRPTLGVRTLDTLHVAAALEPKAARFWTFDDRPARLAEAEGLATS